MSYLSPPSCLLSHCSSAPAGLCSQGSSTTRIQCCFRLQTSLKPRASPANPRLPSCSGSAHSLCLTLPGMLVFRPSKRLQRFKPTGLLRGLAVLQFPSWLCTWGCSSLSLSTQKLPSASLSTHSSSPPPLCCPCHRVTPLRSQTPCSARSGTASSDPGPGQAARGSKFVLEFENTGLSSNFLRLQTGGYRALT